MSYIQLYYEPHIQCTSHFARRLRSTFGYQQNVYKTMRLLFIQKDLHYPIAGDSLMVLSVLYAGLAKIKGPCIMGTSGVHSIKFQSVVTPNGMIAHLFDQLKGKGMTVGC